MRLALVKRYESHFPREGDEPRASKYSLELLAHAKIARRNAERKKETKINREKAQTIKRRVTYESCWCKAMS